jgi:hypothetical protein
MPSAEKFFGILGSGILMAAFIYIFRESNFFILGFLSIGAYLTALWLLRAVKTEEILSIISRKAVSESPGPDIPA